MLLKASKQFCYKRYYTQSTQIIGEYSNFEATKLLKELYSNKQNKNGSVPNNTEMIQKAVEIYEGINEDRHHYVVNTFLSACLYFKHPQYGVKLWNDIKSINKVSLSLILKCCVNCHQFDKYHLNQCLQILKYMKRTNYINKNRKTDSIDYSVSISSLISLCSDNINKLQRVHTLIDDNNDIFIKTALIKAYGICNDVEMALNIFNSILKKDTVSINAMMTVLNDNEWFKHSIQIYQQFESLHNETSHLLALQSCTNLCDYELGKNIDSKININELESKMRIKFATTLINLYGNCLDINNVIKINDMIHDKDKDIVFLSALMEAYYNNNWNTECLELFKNLNKINKNVKADTVCYAIALKVCTQATAYHFGKKIHNELANNNDLKWILKETEIEINLIDLYGKCGYLNICENIFDDIKHNEYNKYLTEINIWNAMIHSYGRNGNINKAFDIYKLMEFDGVNRDKNTYILIISACSHCGDLKRAKQIWDDIDDDNIKYDCYLISALVDCYARNGYLKEGKELILQYEKYSNNNYYEAMWTSLMSGCNKYGNKLFAEQVHDAINKRFDMKQARHLASTSILLANIYGATNDFKKKNEIRADMKRKGLDKYQRNAISEIDINGTIHRFIAGDSYRKKYEYKEIDNKLSELLKILKNEYGYKPDISLITREVHKFKNETEEYILMRHSEKIALIYGILKTNKDYEIVINKNLRICSDCHKFMKLMSKLENRRFVVSDSNRVHIFKDGDCNCNDFY